VLLRKETNALAFAQGLPQLPLEHTAPSPEQLHGIELNAYAHELAQVTIWIGYIQWMRDNGYGFPSEPILKPLDAIQHMDAILAHDAEGRPVEPEWSPADVIIGNPPFLGGKKVLSTLGQAYADSLFELYKNRVDSRSDLVTYWFEHARTQISVGRARRVGLLATQNIRSGLNRGVLENIIKSGRIFMAWSDREWILDGAAVRVSMIGFDNGEETDIQLDGKKVSTIFSNLTSAVDITQAKQLLENAGICLRTDEKGGPFEIPETLASTMLSAPLNVNNRPNSDVVIPWISGIDIVQRPRNQWIIDFGIDMSLQEAAQYTLPFEYVKSQVKPTRESNRIPRLREQWWIHRGPGLSMREARGLLSRYIVTLRVARHPVFVFIDQKYLPDVRLIFFARDDDYFLGVLQSKAHVAWFLEAGTRHGVGNDPTYIPTTCFETFPFPWAPGTEPAEDADARVGAIAQAARDLVAKRDAWLNPPGASEAELKKRTLTALYNQRPTWLAQAHEKLDRAVFAAYGWPPDISDEEILERLLALNLERAQVHL